MKNERVAHNIIYIVEQIAFPEKGEARDLIELLLRCLEPIK
jgi:hypothetical protein